MSLTRHRVSAEDRRGRRPYPTAAVRPLLAAACRSASTTVALDAPNPFGRGASAMIRYEEGGVRLVARRLSERFDVSEQTAYRQLQRITSGETTTIGERWAERVAIVLGLHTDIIWPNGGRG